MRIRKNAKLSPSWFSHASAPEALQTHVCQLNQSPWDAIPFAQDSNQLEGEEDSITGNASLADSVGAVESVSSMMDAVAAKADEMAVYDNDKVEKRANAFDHSEQRARENEFGFENTNNSISSTSPSFRRAPAAAAAAAAAAAGARRARARAGKKGSSSSSNPYEFYYYSGFGPLWARKRGDRGLGGAADASKSNEAAKLVDSMTINTTRSSTPSSSSQIDNNNDDFDYVDDDDDDDEDDAKGDSGKKRMRKPVKARSLKSLM